MRLLVTTQAVDLDDPILGFFHTWIEALAKECETVTVVCLREGRHALPRNVHIYSLGKERGSRSRFAYASHLLSLAYAHRREYDAVVVHMNPEYLVVCGWLWKLLGKRTGLWYVHKSVTLSLCIGSLFADVIFTASPESFRLKSRKTQIVGHGINIAQFSLPHTSSEILRIVTIGRISRSKRIIEMIRGIVALAHSGTRVTFSIYGVPVTEDDKRYFKEIEMMIHGERLTDTVHLRGAIPHHLVAEILAQSDVALNLSLTGSIDKAVLEAFAAGVPVVTCNEAFAHVEVATKIASAKPKEIVHGIHAAQSVAPDALKQYVAEHHSLDRLIKNIVQGLA